MKTLISLSLLFLLSACGHASDSPQSFPAAPFQGSASQLVSQCGDELYPTQGMVYIVATDGTMTKMQDGIAVQGSTCTFYEVNGVVYVE